MLAVGRCRVSGAVLHKTAYALIYDIVTVVDIGRLRERKR